MPGVADKLFLMAYDEHYIGGDAGPVASQPWFVDACGSDQAAVGPDKAIVAIGNYAYDWPDGKTNADAQTNEDSLADRARQQMRRPPSIPPAAMPLRLS
jgi:spore germination protein YaaH